MKLIIEIPNDIYENAKNGSETSIDERMAIKAISNGIPLEDINEKEREMLIKRAHLEGFHEASIMYHKIIEDIKAEIIRHSKICDPEFKDAFEVTVQIINKHIGDTE